jgi:hypothetical protein
MELKLSLTRREWLRYLAEFDFACIGNPKLRLGNCFVHDYPDIADDLREHSHLGGNPGHCPSMDELLAKMDSNLEAKLFIQEFVEITDN